MIVPSIIQLEQAKTNLFYMNLKVDGVDMRFRVPKFNVSRDDSNFGFFTPSNSEKGKYFFNKDGNAYTDICWTGKKPKFCDRFMDSIVEKTPDSSGPLRQIYSKPLVIIYGTPQSFPLRSAIKDYAIYLSNQILISQDSFIRVLSGMIIFL